MRVLVIAPHMDDEALRVLAQKRGVGIGFKYAEGFMLVREKFSK
jgi:hypothetical protein|tara:strand:+ start:379 stop:510 length:132 start_codon:yes stop_codon:yes gene_type:complete